MKRSRPRNYRDTIGTDLTEMFFDIAGEDSRYIKPVISNDELNTSSISHFLLNLKDFLRDTSSVQKKINKSFEGIDQIKSMSKDLYLIDDAR